jgi:hypothetical protein
MKRFRMMGARGGRPSFAMSIWVWPVLYFARVLMLSSGASGY